MHDMSFISLIANSSLVVKAVMLTLLIFSITSWAIILFSNRTLSVSDKEFNKFKKLFYSDVNLNDLYTKLSLKTSSLHTVESLFVKSYREFIESKNINVPKNIIMQNIERHIKIILVEHQNKIENRLSTLASIQSMAPYIGLFGTVWGIMQSFRGLATATQSSISSVAPGISEALIATALGLIVAIPAGLFYNKFINSISWLNSQYAIFAEQIIGIIEYKIYSNE